MPRTTTVAPARRSPWLAFRRIAALLAMAVASVGCADEGTGPADGPPVAVPSFQADVQPILWSPTCVSSSCHSAASRQGGLSLEGVEPDSLVGVSTDTGLDLVIPFDAETSYLVRKLEGRDIQGSRMPLGRGSLPGSQIGTIRNWIDQGALDN
jgi:hypothetical protein